MNKTTLLPYPHTMALGEAFQANNMKFAFVNPTDKGFQMIHSYVQCREYFNEMLMANHHKDFKFVTTYGFNYRPNEFPMDMSATRIAIKFMDVPQKETFLNNLKWIHHIESVNKVELTTILDVNQQEIVLIADKMWISKCILTNIYTLLVKLAALDISNLSKTDFVNLKVKQRVPSEIEYIKDITIPTFNSLVENCTVIANTPTPYVDGTENLRSAGEVHVSSGIVYLHHNEQNKNSMQTLYNQIKGLFKGKFNNEFIKVS